MITFFVAGDPAPQGSKVSYGKGRMVESSKKLKPWRERVTAVAKTRVLDEPLDGHLRLIVNFYMPAPLKSKFGSRPAGTPDLDKLVRAVGDALTASKLIKDDARIVSLIAHKHWALDTPGAEITIERLPV